MSIYERVYDIKMRHHWMVSPFATNYPNTTTSCESSNLLQDAAKISVRNIATARSGRSGPWRRVRSDQRSCFPANVLVRTSLALAYHLVWRGRTRTKLFYFLEPVDVRRAQVEVKRVLVTQRRYYRLALLLKETHP